MAGPTVLNFSHFSNVERKWVGISKIIILKWLCGLNFTFMAHLLIFLSRIYTKALSSFLRTLWVQSAVTPSQRPLWTLVMEADVAMWWPLIWWRTLPTVWTCAPSTASVRPRRWRTMKEKFWVHQSQALVRKLLKCRLSTDLYLTIYHWPSPDHHLTLNWPFPSLTLFWFEIYKLHKT